MSPVLEWMASLMPHLMLAPIMLPMLVAALMLLLKEEHQSIKVVLNIGATALGLLVAIALLVWADQAGSSTTLGVYLPGNWQAPFGIVLALDRLTALMLVLTSSIALASSVFAAARWHKAGVHFHPLFQLQLMGLSGAFLTADLFNLFVFFEIMLAASYGLLLHGSGRLRVQAGLHYIAINLAASSLFLIGVSMLYGITGTLNMADLAQAIPNVSSADRGLLHTAAGILATAFLIKAALWPLNFWLVPAYSAATAPVGALFALMTKVGIYTILRLWTLMFSSEAGESAAFGSMWLIAGGMLTMAFGGIGTLAATRLTHLAGYAAILSSGTLLAAIGFGQNMLTAGLLYYLPSSTLAVAILFMLADIMDRWRNDGSLTDFEDEEAPFLSAELVPTQGLNLDENERVLIGRAIPASAAFLGLAFIMCTLVVTGLPPLSGFIGKFAMLTNLINPMGLGQSAGYQAGQWGWVLLTLMISTGLFALIALTRAGIRHFWATHERGTPELRVAEGLPIAALMALCIVLTVKADHVMQYTQNAANALHAPGTYIQAVMATKPIPNPGQIVPNTSLRESQP
ncbi:MULTISPECIES: monovalent cation/H+ antiporter subunit D [Comamonas]|jgi:multicomponent K+:H+ antiporter subunit D|uniref:Monovalent cation/H+ antiporter subunit D n=1 Tax=Comamonas aquatica TaxID=225991 RepID=A0AA35DBT8_9BURK|nr:MULTISPECIES: monovalent cation/H+ antiporter subunit D [Comamonas]MDE1556402.1 monovalent cation/H+ antiporter subunit D [Comamonas aquatica]MDH0200545.1 monovalent cation/H+ antiporter subunit D [Comamonas aquatica]MDH0899085.1 monovalent cation/H+ antiporter subunit D [Comamonas aquatica]MDH1428118.1 monovalent cation/H+ antiporter subunit D [Comamonas aquatica]MDH1447112.1 monovalent cation/H+ antiporter subunit D [Comamonas aquatica]